MSAAISLYESCRKYGATIDSHASDLYILDDETGRRAIATYQEHGGSVIPTTFYDSERRRWFDAPFAYEPYWEARR